MTAASSPSSTPSSPLTAKAFTEIDEKFVLEVATGLEDAELIARRYGFTPEQYAVLAEYKPFQAEVSRMRAELERSGQTFRIKASLMASELLDLTFVQATGADITFPQRLDALRTLTKLADLEPKAAQAAQVAGTGFSIVINIPQVAAAPQPVTINATPLPAKPAFLEAAPVETFTLEYHDGQDAGE